MVPHHSAAGLRGAKYGVRVGIGPPGLWLVGFAVGRVCDVCCVGGRGFGLCFVFVSPKNDL